MSLAGQKSAYIVEARRSPVGRRNGGLAKIHPVDLAAAALTDVVTRAGIPPDAVGDVIFGCANQIGAQAGNIARMSWLAAGLPVTVPGVTVDRRCGSSQQAIEFAAQAVLSGYHDIVIAGGVEVMSLVPIASPENIGLQHGFGDRYGSDGWARLFGTEARSQFDAAELMATRFDISRHDMELFALESHQRAAAAWDAGHFDTQVLRFDGITQDEGIRRDTSLEAMGGLKTLRDGGRITAALASQISDGAAALLIASEEAVERYGLKRRARLVAGTVVGSDPVSMFTAPIDATRRLLARTGLGIDAIDLFEVNEAFASVTLAWIKETGADRGRTNVNGGAIALGHPIGATGARLATTLIHELELRNARYGLLTMCEGGGTANATLLERV
jgi:acetyl-CoA C-acetyltransferase